MKFKDKIEVVSTHNLLCRKLTVVEILSKICRVCRKFATSYPAYFLTYDTTKYNYKYHKNTRQLCS